MTPQQNKLYRWLLDRIDDPIGPTTEEMRVAMGFASKSGVHRILEALQEQRRITRTPRRDRTVRAVPFDRCSGLTSAEMIAELKRRGEWPHGR